MKLYNFIIQGLKIPIFKNFALRILRLTRNTWNPTYRKFIFRPNKCHFFQNFAQNFTFSPSLRKFLGAPMINIQQNSFWGPRKPSQSFLTISDIYFKFSQLNIDQTAPNWRNWLKLSTELIFCRAFDLESKFNHVQIWVRVWKLFLFESINRQSKIVWHIQDSVF